MHVNSIDKCNSSKKRACPVIKNNLMQVHSLIRATLFRGSEVVCIMPFTLTFTTRWRFVMSPRKKPFETMWEKEHVLLLPQCFTMWNTNLIKFGLIYYLLSANALNLDKAKILSSSKELILYHTILRLNKPERDGFQKHCWRKGKFCS